MVIVAVAIVVIIFTFANIFAFEKKKNSLDIEEEYLKITDSYIEQLYSYIPKNDEYNRATMYNTYYTKFPNLSKDVILAMIYNNIVNYNQEALLNVTDDDLKKFGFNKSEVMKPLHWLKIDVINETGKKMFGKDAVWRNGDFLITRHLKAKYLENVGYLIYEDSSNPSDESAYLTFKLFNGFSITDEGRTIEIYDYFTMCEKNQNICYDDEKKTIKNNNIKKKNGTVVLNDYLDYARGYKHIFKYEDGYYYWYSSDLIK